MQVAAVVLAGGRSRRMGRPKEAMPLAGSSMLGHVTDTMLLCAHPVLVQARDADQELPPLPVEVEVGYDTKPGSGPLLALTDGMRALVGRCDAVFVVACDFPFVSEGFVGWLAERLQGHDLVMPRVGGTLQPLLAMYRIGLLGWAEKLVAQGARTPRSLVDDTDALVLDEAVLREFDPELRFARNVNDPESYAAAIAELGE